MSAYRKIGTRATPQNQPIPGEEQVKNNAGGYVYAITKWAQLDRFLILGTEGGTYYVDEGTLTKEAASNVVDCIKEDGPRTVQTIVGISKSGRAFKNDPAIFALAMCTALGDLETKRLAAASLRDVCRIGTHLFHFAQYVEQFRGWGRLLKGAVANWYDSRDATYLSLDLIKYRQRDGWGHDDLIKLSHPNKHGDLYDWVLRGLPGHEEAKTPDYKAIVGFEAVQKAATAEEAVRLIYEYQLPREAIPTQFLKERAIWEALLEDMPPEAMVRNLGNMGASGLLAPLSDASKKVVGYLQDTQRLRRARLHPLKVLNALIVYKQGHGVEGDNKWPVVPQVVDALDAAFYDCFPNVTPTNKRHMLALDVSGSMGSGFMTQPRNPKRRNNLSVMSCAQATGALSLVTAKVEPEYHIMGFATEFKELGISANSSLAEAFKRVQMSNFGGTDCSLPMTWAQKNKIHCDVFVVYTDNETWAGAIQPKQALQQYREWAGHDAKCIVVGMRTASFSIADPKDGGMLDVVGFDTSVPEGIAEFVR